MRKLSGVKWDCMIRTKKFSKVLSEASLRRNITKKSEKLAFLTTQG